MTGAAIPVLLYHAVSDTPSKWIADFTVTPTQFAAHMDVLRAAACSALTVSELADARRGDQELPHRAVVVSLDDAFADTWSPAAPTLNAVGIRATVYVTTGWLGGHSPGGALMLSWREVLALHEAGHEIGAHFDSHPESDVLRPEAAAAEIIRCKNLLEEALGTPVRDFAYPHGYCTRRVRQLVAEAGYDNAVTAANTLSGPRDMPFAIPRITVTSRTGIAQIRAWLQGQRAPRGHPAGALGRCGWRVYRRIRRFGRDGAGIRHGDR